jgi:hypothetical protein
MAVSNGITRVYGNTVTPNPVTLHGGYPMTFLKIVDANSGFTADTTSGGKITAEGGFTVAIRAIQQIATIVYIGTRANGQFVVALDSSTINAYVSANTDSSVTAAVDFAITATSTFGDTITVTDISGLAAGALA